MICLLGGERTFDYLVIVVQPPRNVDGRAVKLRLRLTLLIDWRSLVTVRIGLRS